MNTKTEFETGMIITDSTLDSMKNVAFVPTNPITVFL